MLKTIITFILVFGVLVFIHELGHFLFAKRAGVFVREFAIGFGPKLFQKKHGETTYTIRLLPLGGYVMMAGDDEEDLFTESQLVYLQVNAEEKVKNIYLSEDTANLVPFQLEAVDLDERREVSGYWPNDPVKQFLPTAEEVFVITEDHRKLQMVPKSRQYPAANRWHRFLINVAGPLFNFLLAIVVFSGIAFSAPGIPTSSPIIGEVLTDSPAAAAGLHSGDEVQEVAGQEVSTWNEMVMALQDRGDQPTKLAIKTKEGQKQTVTLTPKLITDDSGNQRGQIGVQVYMEKGFWDRLLYGVKQTFNIIASVFSVIYAMITGKLGMNQLGGPIAIFQATGEVTRSTGILGVMSFLGFLSVNLGTMNLLPIPGLDGGKILLLIVETIRRKPISKDKEYLITLIGIVCLLVLMLIVTWQDISRVFLR